MARLSIPNDGRFSEWPRRSKRKIKRIFARILRRDRQHEGDDDGER